MRLAYASLALAYLITLPVQADVSRTIAVTGEATVNVVPDQALVTLTVTDTQNAASKAREEVNEVAEEVFEALDDIGIDKRSIRSSGTSLQPNYRWDANAREQLFQGYEARREIAVTIEDLEDVGDVLESATRLGVTRISSPRLISSEADAARKSALTAAFDDAKTQAELLADAADLDLGEAISMDTRVAGASVPMPVARMAAADAENSGPGVEPGEMAITVRLRVVFEAED